MSDVGESPSKKVQEPAFNGYQLIGDSQFLRFSESLLNLKRQEKDGYSLLGLCVSGQRIRHLLRRVRNSSENVSERIVLMIGTNDLLGGTILEEMYDGFKKLLQLLSQNAKKMILLTLPPVLKLEKNRDHWDRLKKFNEFIREFHDGEKFFVGDAYVEFVIPKEPPNVNLCLTNCEKSLGPTSICDSKDDVIGPANEDEMLSSQTESLRNASDGDKFFPAQSETLEAHPQSISSDLKNNDKECSPCATSTAASDGAPTIFGAALELASNSALILSIDATTTPSSGSSTSFFGNTVPPSAGNTTPPSSVGVMTVSPDTVSTLFVDDATMTTFNCTSPTSRVTPDSSVTHSYCAMTPSDNVKIPSGATATSDGATTLPDDASLPLGAVSPSGDAVTPLCDISTLSDTTTSGGGMSPSGGSTIPSDDEILISGGIMTRAAGEISSGDAPMLSEDGMSTSVGATAQLGGEMSPGIASSSSDSTVALPGGANTLFSGNDDTFTPPSNKRRAFKRKLDSFSSDRNAKSRRKRYSYPSDDNYQFKRRFALSGKRNSYSSGDRCLNDSGERGSGDEVEIENADKIRAEYFEKYYDSERRRPDLIHLNGDGFCVIKRIIERIMDAIGVEKSEVELVDAIDEEKSEAELVEVATII